MGLVLRYIFLSGIVVTLQFISIFSFAQDRCGTVEYNKSRNTDHSLHKQEFENWLDNQMRLRQSSRSKRQQSSPYQIPVVVHVIHNGESIGTGANISEAQILSQIKVLNDDFNRRNADAASTPPEFASVAGTLDIEFILAKRNHDGLATNGIVRVNGGKSSWTANDNYTLKETSYWPAEEYFNIWVCNLIGNLGYAQLPESDLEGMENSSTNRLTDGIVVWYGAFGSIDDGDFNLDPLYNKGRTATHETGHFFGLNHIWGDDVVGCWGTDYVNDTPNQAGKTETCPTHPKTDGCGEVIMFQNFLDYTTDDCMNLFTQGQVERMITVIENSPRRNSLLTSPGLQEPDPLPNDLGIRTIIFPDATVCHNLVTPVIEVRNYGNNQITGSRIRFILDGATLETKDHSLALNPMESAEVNFTAVSIPSGEHVVAFEILLTNGGADGSSQNNVLSAPVIVPGFINAPFTVNFNSQPAGWITQNPDGQITWQVATAPKETPANKALTLNYFDYEDKGGEVDIFLSPVIDLSSVSAATLTFDVAHARYQSHLDRLKVVVLTDCEDVSNGDVLYDKAGNMLATAPASSGPFTPTGTSQWRKEFINLSAYIGTGKMQLAFVGINDWGNNIYLDNISISTDETTDIALVSLTSPSIVTCENPVSPKIIVQNAGTIPLTGFDLEYAINGGATQIVTIGDLDLNFGEEKEIALPTLDLPDGPNTLHISLNSPNNSPDINPANNQGEYNLVINQSTDRIPLRENFDAGSASAWTTINPQDGMNWQTISTNYDQSMYFNAYNNDVMDDEAWLVSPVLDFSRAVQASLLFDISYAGGTEGGETLAILASTDCGTTFTEINYNFPPVETASESWLPKNQEDWERKVPVNLHTLAGKENVRIAFVVRNRNGNNLYLDNIEFFNTADPNTLDIPELYSIYGYDLAHPEQSELKITFNLPKRQNVRYTIVSVTGKIETDGILVDMLNQTFPLNSGQRLAPGMYFVRLQIGMEYYTTKILVMR